ncbi:MAG: cyclic nucleotide-binding domain-containing protein [Deltaproteobacteria bacterium]|nr:cyclic nucleotide-binding domain-containing protein [Deltaproteobacteria bacterium]
MLGAAQLATAALSADQNDHEAHLVCAEAVAALGDKTAARDALLRLCRTIAETGDLYMALAAVLKAKELGGKVQEVLDGLASTYGAGSDRLRNAAPAAPPPVPRGALPEVQPAERGQLVLAAKQAMMEASDGAELSREFDEPAAVPRAAIFSLLDREAFVELARALRVRRFPAGEIVLEEGTPGSSFFIVANGEVNVERKPPPAARAGSTEPIHLARLGPGSVFGEMAIISRTPRSASVVAAVPVVLLEADRDAIEMAALAAPRVGEEVVEYCRRRMLSNLLNLSPILRRLDSTRRASLLRQFEMQFFDRGAVLIREDEASAGMYLLVSGEVEVSRKEDAEPLVLARLGPGNVVGEISLVLRRPATASVVAIHPTTVLHLGGEKFLEIVRDHADLLAELYELAIRRETETMSILAAEAESADTLLI